MGQELYSYKNQGDNRHQDMHSLTGVYIKDEVDEFCQNGYLLYLFMLIFPNKRRIYYFRTQEDK